MRSIQQRVCMLTKERFKGFCVEVLQNNAHRTTSSCCEHVNSIADPSVCCCILAHTSKLLTISVQWRRNEFESWGHQSGANVGALIRREALERRKFFFGRAPPLFGSKSTISRFGERFRDGQYSLVSFLFAVLLLTAVPPPVPSHL